LQFIPASEGSYSRGENRSDRFARPERIPVRLFSQRQLRDAVQTFLASAENTDAGCLGHRSDRQARKCGQLLSRIISYMVGYGGLHAQEQTCAIRLDYDA